MTDEEGPRRRLRTGGAGSTPAVHLVAEWASDIGTGQASPDAAWDVILGALPSFPGHRQPAIPLNGTYDAADALVMERHFAAAQAHGITAFAHRVRAGRPSPALDAVAASPDVAVRFLVLVEQGVAPSDPAADADLVVSWLDHPRYATIDERPVVVAEPGDVGWARAFAGELRARCAFRALEPLLVLVDTAGRPDPAAQTFDVAMERPPVSGRTTKGPARPSYGAWAVAAIEVARPAHPWARRCFAGYDDTPLAGPAAVVAEGATPAELGRWLRFCLEDTVLHARVEHWLVHVGAWNDWGHGIYLEPDVELGDARLLALSRACAEVEPLCRDVAAAHADGRRALLDAARRRGPR